MIGFCFFTLISVTSALTNKDGPCPTAYPVNNFNFTAYTTGKWFEIARYAAKLTDREDCVNIEYLKECCGMTFRVSTIKDGKRRYFEGITTIPVNPTDGTVNHISEVIRETENISEIPVNVLDTDYKSYAIVYFCQYNEYKDSRTEFSWILSRYPNMTYGVEKSIDWFLKYTGVIDSKKLIWSGYTRGTC